MKPPPFQYVAVGSIEEAVSALGEHAGEAKILAGGQSLVPMLNFRLLSPAVLVDIHRIPGLDGVAAEDGGLRIGALTRHHTLETSAIVRQAFPVLSAAMPHIAHLAIRNRGTIGGSLVHADPAAELPLMALLLDGDIKAVGPTGPRTIAVRDFFLGALTTVLEETEIVTEITLPALPPGSGWGFEEVTRRSGDFALAAVAVTLSRTGHEVDEARVAVMGAHETPLRITAAERLLKHQSCGPEVIEAAAEAAREAVRPMSDLHASADYRRHLVQVLTRRALKAAWRRALGDFA